ncbi:MAG: hypothetical protein CVV27_02990 [Candidatus Melainabacteria bacterium HGW-Melainabacteria-1]|nr:MAG: hypothetical protein CVV27_02990 [Candidatus Melainabacteria bacterium HGW-Melainabacteria-1]
MFTLNKAALEAFVAPDYVGKDIMHGWAHIQRLLRLARQLASDYSHDPEVLELGAYFHGNIYAREDEIRRFLTETKLPAEQIERVVQAAYESQTDARPESIEGKLLHDAHLLEGGKTFMITKSLVTGTARGQSLEATLAYIENHVLGKFQCCLPESQALYAEKEAYTRDFLSELKSQL